MLDACWQCHPFRKPRYLVIGILVLFACALSIIQPGQQKSSSPVQETVKQHTLNITAKKTTEHDSRTESVIPASPNKTLVGVNESLASVGAPLLAGNASAPQQQELWIMSNPNYGRLGNQIWQFASTFGIYHQAKHTWTNSSNVHLCFARPQWPFGGYYSGNKRQVFREVLIPKACPNNLNDGTRISVSEKAYAKYQHYDLRDTCRRRSGTSDKCIVAIGGYLQSHLYLRLAETEIRQALLFHDSLLAIVNHTWNNIMATSSNNGTASNDAITVGIHVRRTDVAQANAKGQTMQMRLAPNQYYVNAMKYFRSKYGQNTRFVVASDDKEWCRQEKMFSNATVLPPLLSVETDFCLLSTKCQHMIMSVGTFGWWAGWLARGEVVFYDKGLNLEAPVNRGKVNLTHYYPEHWIAIGG